ncbi:phenylalanyl-tRNA synthetase subunit beta [Rugosibacter aromaticivorans]|uniref:Phenylalanine--tRNA ligase beta subunit n=1 Tax=Rugosibacter aromaticivorans TaxID=1565605 RepID=A0A0C5J9A2_9PROT|nr:phenylalanine--tRNA ligase subunit beta [Rugosibacter aromaticivorans]AJP48249.1 phenylalanyl-tRNA synthetase subunit beta [Rugosibacter aromaticivorans]TBR14471.1 MAG: phenylalanine--tRNA ligase subunit beta [Rugosibacter sp.]
MQFSESWLRSLCNPPLNTEELCHILTMAGLEVEEVKAAAPEFSGVFVAQVLTVEKHPDADKLNLCSVDAGQGEILQIVCGAPNVAAGLKVPCAVVGARLPTMEIKQAKVRGLDSFGMLCSSRELGIADDHGGLLVLPEDAVVGENIRTSLDLDDHLITIKLTPNRADCLSLLGIARELSALTGAPLILPVLPDAAPVAADYQDQRAIVLDAPAACPRYCGRILRGVNAQTRTPEWIKRRIERSGIRSISAVVDITNYVMLELGQPLHAFDDTKLSGDIHVRYPQPDELLLLLNGVEIEPKPDMLLIADEQRALALAGIMGGETSSVTAVSTDIFLESAFFAPVAIAGKARTLGFSSDASHRYERGVDFDLPRLAIERATALILACGGGESVKVGPIVEAVSPEHLPRRAPVMLRPARATKVLGIDVTAERAEALLGGLGLRVAQEGDHLVVTPPSFRFDIEIEEDLIEEIARLHGYDNIPSIPPVARVAMMPAAEFSRGPMQIRQAVAQRDYHEIVTYSFVDAAWEADFSSITTNTHPIVLANPIASNMSVMRSTLIGGLVDTLATNRKRQTERVRIFELGRCFFRTSNSAPVTGFDQPLRLAGLAAGFAVPEQWGVPPRRVDFYDVKADVEVLFSPHELSFEPVIHSAFHPGRSARVILKGQPVGVLGELHPRWVQKYALGQAPVVFELELAALLTCPQTEYTGVSRLPTVVRDLALVVAQTQPASAVQNALRAAAPAVVRDIVLFDVYQGQGLSDAQKSIAFHIVMQDTQRTLEDVEIEEVVAKLLAVAQNDFGALLR